MRISRHSMWLDIAEVASRRSTCSRGNNGAILVLNNRIVGFGYNGPPSGEPHCFGASCVPPGVTGCVRSIHAERNAITRRTIGDVTGADIYCTMSPCQDCADFIQQHGITRVFYRYPYRVQSVGCTMYRVTQNGDIIDSNNNLMPEDFQ